MGRPSVKAERTEEILNAFERCVARYGVEGTSLERIAEESGLRRSLLRYYIGNRDEMVEALADRFIARTEGYFRELEAELPEENRIGAMIDHWFTPYEPEDSTTLVAEALIASAERYPVVQGKLRDWYDRLVGYFAAAISADYPDVDKDRCWMVALGIVSIFFNHDSMGSLGLPSRYGKASAEAARLLASTLG
ncbi:TetR/AcrR family transcriptional regulator [Pseudomaricurvus alkylphenolicus]|uniref:TetR/AcrR family transcriptional regulator n=1 Tax=Pseudomaricurvus alkylphenolicus TaxID=1306991 RepID=UPI00141FD93F|nr:TetR family transcriptional regulator [Pseudomaricurvus alkylphenolicus]NIB41495.1 TetR/AcrR family transcriptional regulator [Pseudomaricurvus alkylphenolicus]